MPPNNYPMYPPEGNFYPPMPNQPQNHAYYPNMGWGYYPLNHMNPPPPQPMPDYRYQ